MMDFVKEVARHSEKVKKMNEWLIRNGEEKREERDEDYWNFNKECQILKNKGYSMKYSRRRLLFT